MQKNRPNEPMDRITMPSALLARRLRSSLWCQKQVVLADRGRSQKNMRLLGILYLILGLTACQKPQATEAEKTSFPFRSVSLRDGSTLHSLRLPDGSHLMIKTHPPGNDTSITSVSVIQKGGVAFAADYEQKEYFYSSPPFNEFKIWTYSTDGSVTLASEQRHKKHAETMRLFEDFFDKTIGQGMGAEDAVKEMDKLKEKLKQAESKK